MSAAPGKTVDMCRHTERHGRFYGTTPVLFKARQLLPTAGRFIRCLMAAAVRATALPGYKCCCCSKFQSVIIDFAVV